MSARCHYCGWPARKFVHRRAVCRSCDDLPRLEPGAMRERPLLRPPTRGLGS